MNCSKSDEYFMKYMDNALTESEALKLNTHLKDCEKCRTDFLIYDSLMKEFSSIECIEAPEDLEIRVMAEIAKLEPIYNKSEKNTNTIFIVLAAVLGSLLGLSFILFINREAILNIMSGYPQLEAYVAMLRPVSNFVTELTANIGSIMTKTINEVAMFLNSFQYLILVVAVSLFALQIFLYKKEKGKVEE